MVEPLTIEEQAFAEENHNLIYAYLHRHNLDIDEWYGVAAIGYVMAVKAWFKKSEYPFGWTAFCYIGSQVSHEFSARQSQKRTADVISYDVPHSKDLFVLDTLAADDNVEEQTEKMCMVKDIAKAISPKYTKLFNMLALGFTQSEIARAFGVTASAVSMQKMKMRKSLSNFSI